PLRHGTRRVRAMTYILRRHVPGIPRPGYVEMIAAAARGWKLPEAYVRSVERWSASRWTSARRIDAGELLGATTSFVMLLYAGGCKASDIEPLSRMRPTAAGCMGGCAIGATDPSKRCSPDRARLSKR